MQLIIEVCLFTGDWNHWMHEYVRVALRQSEICFKSLIINNRVHGHTTVAIVHVNALFSYCHGYAADSGSLPFH